MIINLIITILKVIYFFSRVEILLIQNFSWSSPVSRISQPLWLTNATTRMQWFTASGEEQMVYIGAACSRTVVGRYH